MSERDPRYKLGQRERAAELYRSGLSERAVAERLGVSKTVARNYLDDAGVRRRSRKAAGKRRWADDGVGRRRAEPAETEAREPPREAA